MNTIVIGRLLAAACFLGHANAQSDGGEPGPVAVGVVSAASSEDPTPLIGSFEMFFESEPGMPWVDVGDVLVEAVDGTPELLEVSLGGAPAGSLTPVPGDPATMLFTDVQGQTTVFHFSLAPRGWTSTLGASTTYLLPEPDTSEVLVVTPDPPVVHGNLEYDLHTLGGEEYEVPEAAFFYIRYGSLPPVTPRWVQFVAITVNYGGFDDSNTPWEDTYKGPPLRISGNGGLDDHDSATMDGYAKCDGSTTYVDAAYDIDPSYGAPGTNRSTPTMHLISDAPGGVDGWGDILGTLADPNDRPITWATVRFDFTTYLLLNDVVVYRFEWFLTWFYTLDITQTPVDVNGIPIDGAITGQGAEDAFDPNHQLAHDRYVGGNHLGAPAN